VGRGISVSREQSMEQLGSEEARRRYGPNWKEVVEYIEAIPFGFMLNNCGERNPRDSTVRRVRNLEELEQITYFGEDAPTADESPYLRFGLYVYQASEAVTRLARERGLEQELENAWHDAGGTDLPDLPDSFHNWTGSLPEMREEWYWRQIADDRVHIAWAMVLGRCPETEVFYEMWYWYQAGHWPCGWEGEWPQGRLIVF